MHYLNKVREKLLDVYYWALNGRWKVNPGDAENKYTIILPVIADFFSITEFNLRFLSSCHLQNRDQIIVVSDNYQNYTENETIANKYSSITNIKVTYVVLPLYKRLLLKLNFTSQVIFIANVVEAVNRSKTKYVYLHDADFFIFNEKHIEQLFKKMNSEGLNLISTFERDYGEKFFDNKYPATYELFLNKNYLHTQPTFKLLGCNINNVWYPTFTRFYISSNQGKEVILDCKNIGIHFKHLFNRYRAFEKENRRFVDTKFAIFLMYALSAANSIAPKNFFESFDDYFDKVIVKKNSYYEHFKTIFLLFSSSSGITSREKKLLTEILHKLEMKLAIRD